MTKYNPATAELLLSCTMYMMSAQDSRVMHSKMVKKAGKIQSKLGNLNNTSTVKRYAREHASRRIM